MAKAIYFLTGANFALMLCGAAIGSTGAVIITGVGLFIGSIWIGFDMGKSHG